MQIITNKTFSVCLSRLKVDRVQQQQHPFFNKVEIHVKYDSTFANWIKHRLKLHQLARSMASIFSNAHNFCDSSNSKRSNLVQYVTMVSVFRYLLTEFCDNAPERNVTMTTKNLPSSGIAELYQTADCRQQIHRASEH